MQIKYKTGLCSVCEKERLIVNKSKKLCLFCNQKASVERSRIRRKERIAQGKELDKSKLARFYKKFYEQHPTKTCFETDEPITSYKSWNCHHLLEKKNYPQYAFLIDICVLLTLEMHALWHSLDEQNRAEKMPRTYKQYMIIKSKYDNEIK